LQIIRNGKIDGNTAVVKILAPKSVELMHCLGKLRKYIIIEVNKNTIITL
jgi:hypothetical protein